MNNYETHDWEVAPVEIIAGKSPGSKRRVERHECRKCGALITVRTYSHVDRAGRNIERDYVTAYRKEGGDWYPPVPRSLWLKEELISFDELVAAFPWSCEENANYLVMADVLL